MTTVKITKQNVLAKLVKNETAKIEYHRPTETTSRFWLITMPKQPTKIEMESYPMDSVFEF